MKLSRWARRIVASVAGLILLLSVSATAARACILGDISPHDVVASELCPDSAGKTGTPAVPNCLQERNLLQQVTPAATKVAVLAAVDLSPLATRADQPVFPDFAAPATASPPANTPAPPPHILYCRLRN